MFSQISNKELSHGLLRTVIDSVPGTITVEFSDRLGELRELAELSGSRVIQQDVTTVITFFDFSIVFNTLSASFFRAAEYERVVNVRFAIYSNGQYETKTIFSRDTIQSSNFHAVQGEGIFRGNIVGDEGIISYLETATVTAIAVGAVFLFYSVRSK